MVATIGPLTRSVERLLTNSSVSDPRMERDWFCDLCDLAAALFGEFEDAASVATHVGEPSRTAMVFTLPGPEGRTLRGKETVISTSLDVRLTGDHIAGVW